MGVFVKMPEEGPISLKKLAVETNVEPALLGEYAPFPATNGAKSPDASNRMCDGRLERSGSGPVCSSPDRKAARSPSVPRHGVDGVCESYCDG